MSRSMFPMYYGASKDLLRLARELRKSATPAEKMIWQTLNTPAFKSYGFRRQHPIDKFIADFYSHSLKLVIEVDGGYHLEKEQRTLDSFRDEEMAMHAIQVLRFTNEQVMDDIESVSRVIFERIQQLE